MIERIQFENFRALRKAELPLERFTLLVGPNGSGKSSVFRALRYISQGQAHGLRSEQTIGQSLPVVLTVGFSGDSNPTRLNGKTGRIDGNIGAISSLSSGLRVFSFDDRKIAEPAQPESMAEMREDGANLAAVLDRIKDQDEERWEALNGALAEWLPGFDRILFNVVGPGMKSVELRTNPGGYRIEASQLSQGTLIALAILTLSYLPKPPVLVCLEEPDRGLHPRLLQDVKNAIRRLCYPEEFGEEREPVQVIATTHNPFFLDLFRDNPEQIVIAEKRGLEATFKRLSDHPNLKEIIAGVPLGEVWYSGVLGGVPAGT